MNEDSLGSTSSKVIRRPRLSRASAKASAKVVPSDVLSARQDAESILAEARERAEALVAEGRETARELRRRSIERAYRHCLALWQDRFLALQAERRELYEGLQTQVGELALELTAALLQEAFELEPARIKALLDDALAEARAAGASGAMTLRVPPSCAMDAESHLESLRRRDARWSALSVVQDPEVRAGGCRIETDFGEIDATLEVQLRALRQALTVGAGPVESNR